MPLIVAVAIADTVLLWLARGDLPVAGLVAYGLLTLALMAARTRWPVPAFLVALFLALITAGTLGVLVCTSYQVGHRMTSRSAATWVIAGTAGYLVVLGVLAGPGSMNPWTDAARAVVLVALPMAAGRYFAQNRELVAVLERERELVAERERLNERMRIARDMHDALGHRLGLLSIQAAALEVAPLPEREHRAVTRLADAARKALSDLHEVVGRQRRSPGLEAVDGLVAEFAEAGVPVSLSRTGEPAQTAAEPVAYRVIQEGLTNAAKHARGAPVAVRIAWQPDALLVSVANAAGESSVTPGNGLRGLAERVSIAGGLLRIDPGPEFRLVAMLPLDRAAVAV